MATIANLSIGLSADSARLKKDLDKAKHHSKKWASGQKKQFASVAASVKLIGVAVAGISFGAFIRGAIQTSKELKVMSNLTGESAAELQRVAPSLERAGISLEKYSDILKDVNDKSHDFLQTGGGPMKDFFEQIAPKVGVTADAFKGLSGKDALGLYVKSLEDANLSQEQMTFYMEALASDSTMLLPLLRDNAAGMNEFALATNQVLTGATIDTLTNIGTSFSTLGSIVTNMTLEAIAPLLRFIEKMLEGFRALITDFPALVYGFEAVALAVVGLTLAMMANPISLWITAIAAIIAGLAWAYAKFKDLADAVGGVAELMTILADSAKFEFTRIGAYGTKLKLSLLLIFNDIQYAWQETITSLSVSFAEFLDGVADTKVGVMMGLEGGNAETAMLAGGKAMSGISSDLVRLNAAISSNNEILSATNPHFAKLAEALAGDKPITVALDTPSAADLTGGGSGGLGGSGGGSGGGTDGWFSSIAEDFSSTLKSSLSKALKSGDWSSIGDVLMDQLTGSIIDKAVGSAVDFGMSLLGFADGGIVPSTPSSKSYADSVPAMLQPGELVVPVDQVGSFLNGGGSGGGQTFNINVTGDVTRATRSEIVKMMPEIAAGTNMLNKESNYRR